MKLADRFCGCVKSVRKTVKLRRGSAKGTSGKEQAAIAICVKSVLQSKGRTLKRFKCRRTGKKGPVLKTQAPIKNK
jgi:ribosomal protein L22